MTRRRNTRLESLLAELGYTHQALADEVNRLAAEESGEPTNCTDRHVRRWISGQVRCPWPRHLRLLERVLGCGPQDMGFLPRTEAPTRATSQAGTGSTTGDAGSQDSLSTLHPLQRRTFIAGALAATLGTDQTPQLGRLGMSDVDRARATVGRLDAHFNGLGGGALVDVAADYLQRLQRALNQCTCSERVERAMTRAMADVAACAGWSAHDCGDSFRARRFRNEALQAALLSRDPVAVTRAWSDLAAHAKLAGRPAEAARINRAALGERHLRAEPLLASLLHARLADCLARTGDTHGMGRHLTAAARAHDRADPSVTPGWLAFCTPAELSGLGAIAHRSAGRYAHAEQHAQQALDLLDAGFNRNRTFYLTLLAEIQSAQGEHAQAAATVAKARAGLVSGRRIGDRLERVVAVGTMKNKGGPT
ncbi:hypothetical protein [Streptomyces sp. NPDC017940]|uniref:hypothetical protein n=1 Tax=Streptomyces sp. NPDC017940 TaxID=3365017 RepID=UPI0037A3B67D